MLCEMSTHKATSCGTSNFSASEDISVTGPSSSAILDSFTDSPFAGEGVVRRASARATANAELGQKRAQ